MRKLLYIAICCLVMAGCRNSERDNDTLTNTAEENALAEAIFADAFKMVNKAALNAQGISDADHTDTTLFGCDQIVVDTISNPRTLFIDFKFLGCVANYGVTRKGRIIAEFTGTYPETSSIINIVFLNYSFGAYNVDGNIVIVRRGLNERGRPYFTFFVQSGTISTDRKHIVWKANKSWQHVGGMSTRTTADDTYLVSGTSFGLNGNGNEFDAEAEGLNLMLDGCFHFTSGRENINIRNLSPQTINYGSGDCDRGAVVTINGKDHQVTLPQ